jgi:ferredoxin-fold anticodon binding domain-containing protein
MLEWVQISTIIIDQIFKYGPQISSLFKSKESKYKQSQLKLLSNDMANQIQKNLLNDLKKIMDYSVNIPPTKDDLEELNKVIDNIIENESNKMVM